MFPIPFGGAALSVAGNFCISLGFQLQRLAPDSSHRLHALLHAVGVALMVFGECSNFAAIGMAPAALVAPMDGVAILSNVLLSKILLNERISRAGIVGVLMITLGITVVALNAPRVEEGSSDTYVYVSISSYRTLTFVCSTSIVALWVANPLECSIGVSRECRYGNAVYYCYMGGFMAMLTVISAKGTSIAMRYAFVENRYAMFEDPTTCWVTYSLFVLLTASIAAQMKYLHIALEIFRPSHVMFVYYAIFSTLSVSAGVFVFQETSFAPNTYSPLFISGLLLTFVGVFIVSCNDASSYTDLDKRFVIPRAV